MIRLRRRQLALLYIVGDVLAIVAAFFIAYWLRFHSGFLAAAKGVPPLRLYLVVIPPLLLVQLLVFSSQEFYRFKLRRNRLDDLFLLIVNAVLTGVAILLLFSYLKSYRFVSFEVSHVFLAVYGLVAVPVVFVVRILVFRYVRLLVRRRNGVSRVLVAGTSELARMTAANLRKYAHFGIDVVGFMGGTPGPEVLGDYAALDDVLRQHAVTDLFIALPLHEYDTIMQLIETGHNRLVDIHLVPDILQLASLKAGMEHIEGIPVINLGDIPLEGWREALKRGFDVAFSLASLALAAPFMLAVAVWIRLDSPGPVFYRQARVGLDGRIFRIIKFRTMVRDAEKATGPIWSPPNDTRVTRVGRFLRKLSIDEVPQLFNVLRGDMSLVGPRPERPELVETFKQHIPRYMLRHRVKAGLTGWAQVHGLRGNTPLDKRIEFDIYYIQNWTFRLDLEIIFRTLLKFQFIDRGGE